ncbi:response regulator [Bradyrhizobium neotropicale]|nr:response regulator [Bradyrhizobium neotropicale]
MLAYGSHIIVVDDDVAFRQMVIRYLEEHSVPSKAASSRAELHLHLERRQPRLIILDLRLRQDDGLDMLREIRAHSDVPVIITTGHRPDETDRIVGLEVGADDYIIKPFSLRELLARVRAVCGVRRWGEPRRPMIQIAAAFASMAGNWNVAADRLIDVNNTQVPLSKGEYTLLLAVLEAPQRPLTREHLLQATRVHEDIFDRSIDVQVLRLRRKLETDPRAPRIIQTERGAGYVFTIPVAPF